MISKRLPLDVTCHVDRYQESSLQEVVQSYDVVREVAQPYAAQRLPDEFGESDAHMAGPPIRCANIASPSARGLARLYAQSGIVWSDLPKA